MIVFDLETTGLSGAYCDVIQFSYIRLEGRGQIVKAETMYFYHKGMHWDQSVCDNVHHISLEFLEQFEDKFEENLVKMYTVLSRADVIGHNAQGFDCPFASQWLQRMGMPGLSFSSIRDTMKVFQPLTHTARVKLGKLCDMCGITPDMIRQTEHFAFGTSTTSHDANYDVAATAMLTIRAILKGYIQLGGQVTKQVTVDTSEHKVCDGFYVKLPSGTVHVNADGIKEVTSAPTELTLPITLNGVNSTVFVGGKADACLVVDTVNQSCKLKMCGALIDVMNLTMPIENFKKLLGGE